MKLKFIELNWTQLNDTELNWADKNETELNWIFKICLLRRRARCSLHPSSASSWRPCSGPRRRSPRGRGSPFCWWSSAGRSWPWKTPSSRCRRAWRWRAQSLWSGWPCRWWWRGRPCSWCWRSCSRPILKTFRSDLTCSLLCIKSELGPT